MNKPRNALTKRWETWGEHVQFSTQFIPCFCWGMKNFHGPHAISFIHLHFTFHSSPHPTRGFHSPRHFEEVVRLAERSACLVFLVGIWEATDGIGPQCCQGVTRGVFVCFLGVPKGNKMDGNSLKIVGGIWICVVFFVAFSWCCFLLETKDGAPQLHLWGFLKL